MATKNRNSKKAKTLEQMEAEGQDALTKALMGESGILGIKIPKQMQGMVGALMTSALNMANIYVINACKTHLPTMGMSQPWANRVATGVGYTLPLAPHLITIGQKVGKYFTTVKALDEEMQPLLQANTKHKSGFARLFGGESQAPNAIIRFARNQLTGVCRNDITATTVSMGISGAVPLYNAHSTLNGKDTLSERLNKVFNNAEKKMTQQVGEDMMKQMKKEMAKNNFGIASQLDTFLTGAGGEQAAAVVRSNYKKKHTEYDGKSAWDMCVKFRKELASFQQQSPNLSQASRKRSEDHLTNMAKAIFKRRYVESGWGEISDASEEILSDALPQIMQPFLSGELDGFALVNLAGEDKILRHEGSYIANEVEIEEALQEQAEKLSRDSMITPKEYFETVSFQLKDVIHAQEHLSDDEKALFAMILPTKVLKAAGMADEDIQAFREEGHDAMKAQIAEYITNLNQVDIDQLKGMQLTKPDIALLDKMAEHLAKHGPNGLEKYYEEAKRLVATTAMQSPQTFQELVAKSGHKGEKKHEGHTQAHDAYESHEERAAHTKKANSEHHGVS